jgi:hypothetical protein
MENEAQIVDASLLAKEYIELKTELEILEDKHKKEQAVLKDRMEDIRAQMNVLCNTQGASSIRTPHGTIIRTTTTRYWTNDWGSLHGVIIKYNAPYLLEKRICGSAMKEFLEEHPEAHPAGMNVDSAYTVMVRRPTKKI